MLCRLCSCALTSVATARVLNSESDRKTFSFLSGASGASLAESDTVIVCQTCADKVQVVGQIQSQFSAQKCGESAVKQESQESVNGDDDSRAEGDCEGEAEEEDCYEELDQLSSFYAEHNEDDDDPEYDPNRSHLHRKGVASKKRPKKKDSSPLLKCQLCPSALRRVASLRRHYIAQHAYDPSAARSSQGDEATDSERLSGKPPLCSDCGLVFSNVHLLIRHALTVHANAAAETFRCKHCDKAYRHERDLQTHEERLCAGLLGTNCKCDVCHKMYATAHVASHRTHAHECRFCAAVLPTRRDKCRHLKEEHADQMTDACAECGQRFETDKCLRQHRKLVHERNKVTCPRPDCKQLFPKGGSKLKQHLKVYHSPENELLRAAYKFECSECHKKIRTRDLLNAHMATKHPKAPLEKCPFCDYSVPRKRRSDIFRYHIKRAHPEQREVIEQNASRLDRWKEDFKKRSKIQCLLCPYAATKLSNLPRHYADIHGYDKDLAELADGAPDPENPDGALCPECGVHFVNRHHQIRHLLKTHSRSSGEQCLYCTFRYVNLEEHIDSVHVDQKSLSVQLCKKCVPEQNFSSFDDLLRHTRSYHRKPVKPFSDSVASAASKSSSRVHRKREKNRLCENCGKTMPSALMSRHRSECVPVDAAGAKTKKYVPVHLSGICPYCELKFSDLLGHIRHGHADEKSADTSTACPLCSERFGSVRELVTHRQLHPQFKNHTCAKCNASFDSVVELRTHRLRECVKSKRRRKVKKEAASAAVASSSTLTAAASAPAASSESGNALSALGSGSSGLMALVHALNCAQESTVAEESSATAGNGTGGPRQKLVEFEGKGTVTCHLCVKSFTLKCLLRRHYISHHGFDPKLVNSTAPAKPDEQHAHSCTHCPEEQFANVHARIKHQLDFHATISGMICPYCDSKWGAKKFDHLDDHVKKHHLLEMQSPIQTCASCKINFESYEEIKHHRQLHEGGNKRIVKLASSDALAADAIAGGNSATVSSLVVHSRVGANPEISNRGGVKCQLCNAFKLRKEHLKLHYVKHHGYDAKAAAAALPDQPGDQVQLLVNLEEDSSTSFSIGESLSCPSCHEYFRDNNRLIKHLLKQHCAYTGLICPYCRGHFPERFIDLQRHVTLRHIDKLTGYNVSNECKVCKKRFPGYAELRDHVQTHGDAFRDPYGNKEAYRDYARRRKKINGKMVPIERMDAYDLPTSAPSVMLQAPDQASEATHDTSISSHFLEEIINSYDEHERRIMPDLDEADFLLAADHEQHSPGVDSQDGSGEQRLFAV